MRAATTPWTLFLFFLSFFLSMASIAALATSCKAKPGDSCQKGTARCLDEHTELWCQDGKFIAGSCKGPKGCAARGERIECDFSANVEGDVCPTEDENKGACAPDGKSMISCRSSKHEVMACRGPDACKVDPTGSSTCDSSIAEEGDRCSGNGSACSTDGKRTLGCQSGRFAMKWRCRGPDGCSTRNGELHCDYSVAEVGDACDGTGGACTSDRKQMLACQDGKFAVQSLCRGLKGCKHEGDHVSCDGSLAEVGDPCDPKDAACQIDRKALLECKGGKYNITRTCKCAVEGDSVLCE